MNLSRTRRVLHDEGIKLVVEGGSAPRVPIFSSSVPTSSRTRSSCVPALGAAGPLSPSCGCAPARGGSASPWCRPPRVILSLGPTPLQLELPTPRGPRAPQSPPPTRQAPAPRPCRRPRPPSPGSCSRPTLRPCRVLQLLIVVLRCLGDVHRRNLHPRTVLPNVLRSIVPHTCATAAAALGKTIDVPIGFHASPLLTEGCSPLPMLPSLPAGKQGGQQQSSLPPSSPQPPTPCSTCPLSRPTPLLPCPSTGTCNVKGGWVWLREATKGAREDTEGVQKGVEERSRGPFVRTRRSDISASGRQRPSSP